MLIEKKVQFLQALRWIAVEIGKGFLQVSEISDRSEIFFKNVHLVAIGTIRSDVRRSEFDLGHVRIKFLRMDQFQTMQIVKLKAIGQLSWWMEKLGDKSGRIQFHFQGIDLLYFHRNPSIDRLH